MQDVIVREQFYSHPISEVWKAISEGKNISKWFIQADFQPTVGYQYTFTHEDTVIKGEVLEVAPVTTLAYTWIVGETSVATTVRWMLEEKDGGTALKLEHSGISKYPGESAAKMFSSFQGGWASCLNELEGYLEKEYVG